MTRLLYNVSAFMRTGQKISVEHRPGPDKSWPIMIQIGPGGDDTIDIYSDVENATKLRDALSMALDRVEQ